MHKEIESYFDTAPPDELDRAETLDKDHGRLETRHHVVSGRVDWLGSDRAYPGAKRFPNLAVVAMVEATVERQNKTSKERRSYISSRVMAAEDFGHAVRSQGRSKTTSTGPWT